MVSAAPGRVTSIATGQVITTGLINVRRFQQRGGEVRVIHANSAVLKIFDLVGFSEVVTVVPD